jgi:ParB family chromosome partitioning protein
MTELYRPAPPCGGAVGAWPRKPSLALRVMVAHAICGSPLWRRGGAEPAQHATKPMTESVETSVAEARFDERRRAVLSVLGFDPDRAEASRRAMNRSKGVSGLFRGLLEIPDAQSWRYLGVVMAETLASGTGLIETIGLHIGINMADYWVADDAFL